MPFRPSPFYIHHRFAYVWNCTIGLAQKKAEPFSKIIDNPEIVVDHIVGLYLEKELELIS
ncbi:hypothetical protein BSZ32_10200 [Rubritalea profundi]|uniref:Uncharacterized protein n=1 Tax=Rubritalea profundi TaxID=1658618 RepID=A0A2S7U1E3_9BACT|nr:hypothetical protein BSZ32_10200 [Rubritalea profundi]